MATSYGSAGLFVKVEGNLFIPDYGTRVVRNAVKQTLRESKEIARRLTPKDTEYLSKQWKTSNNFTDYRQDVLSNDTYYGVFVDEGTRFIAAQHFTQRIKEETETLFLTNLESALDKLK